VTAAVLPLAPLEARALRHYLRDAGYTQPGLEAALGVDAPPTPHQRNAARLRWLTRAPTPLNLLARWFLLGGTAPADDARRTLPAGILDSCLRAHLLRPDGGLLRAAAVIAPFGDLLLASDSFQQLASPTGADHVLGLNRTARYLLDFTVPRPARETLDLCSGSGIHGLAAAARSGRVTCADLNPRATAFAAFNAALNGLDNVACVTGDRFAPVTGRRFDHIICNPPFVLAPTAEYVYRDNPLPLDAFVAGLAREAPAFLEEGGCFQMICEWVEVAGEPWQDRVGRWFEGSGCDVWLLRDYEGDPARYAEMRLRERLPAGEEEDERVFRRWVEYYEACGVVAIHGGLVAMRRREGANWLRVDEVGEAHAKGLGAAVLDGFAARDFLDAHRDDERLLGARLRVAASCRLAQDHCWADGAWRPGPLRLGQADGLRRRIDLDPGVAAFLGRFDGARPVAEALAELAAEAGAAPAEIRAETLQAVRRMVELGFLQVLPQPGDARGAA
jgi:methylase of polypeptide subunit release factors